MLISLLMLAATLVLIAAIPWLVGSTWTAIGKLVESVPGRWMLVLSVVWLAGLIAHTPVLTSSMPRLTNRQALSLNLAGSAVANAVPLGGAASMGLTTAMARSWGFKSEELGAFFTVSTLWNTLARVIFGVVGVMWIAAIPHHGPVVAMIAVPLAAVCLGFAVALGSDKLSAWMGGALGWLADRIDRLRGRPGRRWQLRFAVSLVRMRRRSLTVIAKSWLQMSAAMTAYFGLLCLLLYLCIRVTSTPPQALLLVVAAVAVERLVTALPITPGGAGVAELGLVGCLTLGGLDATAAVAAAILYRLFTFVMEIPVGLVVAAGWGLGSMGRNRLVQPTKDKVSGGVEA